MIAKPTGMNAIIAEHVFGWKWDKHWAGGCWIIPKQYRDWDCGEPQVTPPNFTEDISDAWHVVEKLSATHGVYLSVYEDMSMRVELSQRRLSYDPDNIVVLASTAPLAICKAALMAVGVEAGE